VLRRQPQKDDSSDELPRGITAAVDLGVFAAGRPVRGAIHGRAILGGEPQRLLEKIGGVGKRCLGEIAAPHERNVGCDVSENRAGKSQRGKRE
jgi:hypothetical protein